MTKPALYINTIFRWCNDVDIMRHFYTDIIGLEETYYRNDNEHGWLTYQIEDIQLVFTRSNTALAIETEWTKSPAYPGGTKELESWVVAVNHQTYEAIARRLKASEVMIYKGELEKSRSAIFVQDPMGMTIEFWLEDKAE